MNKKILMIDMDGVTFDFDSAFKLVAKTTWINGQEKKVPIGFFENLEPIENAIECIIFLFKYFNIYFLSTPQWSNPYSWMEKRISLEKHFGELAFKRLILSHDKGLIKGDFLIDDKIQEFNNGIHEFEGEHIHFGTEKFPDWESVRRYLMEKI